MPRRSNRATQVWGEHNNIPVIAQKPGADSACSYFMTHFKQQNTRGVDVLIAAQAAGLTRSKISWKNLKKSNAP